MESEGCGRVVAEVNPPPPRRRCAMPKVFVRHTLEALPETIIKQLCESIPRLVADGLWVVGGELEAGDVSVDFSLFGPHDVHGRDVEIEVRANYYPERAEGLNEKARELALAIHQSTASGLRSMSVWITLAHGGYFETS